MTSAVKPNSLSSLTVYGVMATHIDLVWHEVIPLLKRSLEYADGKYEVGDVYAFLKSRDMQLFVCMRHGVVASFAITQIVNYPRKKILYVLFAAGIDLHEWPDYMQQIIDWGHVMQCNDIEVPGREGWARVLREQGFKKAYTVARMQL